MAQKTKRIIVLAGKILLSGLLLVVIFRKAGLQGVLSQLETLDIRWVILSSLIHVIIVTLAGLRWSLLLEDRPPLRKVLSLYFIGSFFNNLLPGAVGGDAVKIYYLYRDTRKGGSTFGSVLFDRLIGLFALLAIGLVAGITAFQELATVHMQWAIPALFVGYILGGSVLFGLELGRKFPALTGFYDYSRAILRQQRVLFKALLLSLTLQTLSICSVYAVGRGIGQHLTFPALFIFVPIILTVTALPISVSGLGVREGAFVLLFGLIGIPAPVSASISLLWYFSVAAASLLGLIEYVRFRRRE